MLTCLRKCAFYQRALIDMSHQDIFINRECTCVRAGGHACVRACVRKHVRSPVQHCARAPVQRHLAMPPDDGFLFLFSFVYRNIQHCYTHLDKGPYVNLRFITKLTSIARRFDTGIRNIYLPVINPCSSSPPLLLTPPL